MSEMTQNVRVYAVGVCYASACVPAGMSKEEVVTAVNTQHPTGLQNNWDIANEAFESGAQNPHPCEQKPDHLHYLLSC